MALRAWLAVGAVVVGATLAFAGLWLMYPPAALAVSGAALVGLGLLYNFGEAG